MSVPRVLTIASSDSGGGAGIQADLKAFARCGAHGMSAIVALTAQNTLGVTAIHELPPSFVRAQIDAVLDERREAALAGGGDATPDEAAAELLLAKKLGPILREPDPRRRLRRAYALLARNGFSPDVCSTVAKRALATGADDGSVEPDGDQGVG